MSEEILVEVELNECTLRRDENAIGGKWKEETEGRYKQSGRKVEECRGGEGEFGVNTRGVG